MTDRELLEDAAKAAGLNVDIHENWTPGELPYFHLVDERGRLWNPLTDDGDALRLTARLNINVFYRENINGAFVIADHEGIECCAESLDGPHEDVATRRAIVRAAAAIGAAK